MSETLKSSVKCDIQLHLTEDIYIVRRLSRLTYIPFLY